MIDLHTHIWQYPDHMDEAYASEVRASLGRSIDASEALCVTPEVHWGAYTASAAAHVVVQAFRSRHLGVDVPNEYVADYVRQHPDRLIGFAAVDPSDDDPAGELQQAVEGLGLKGLKLAPAYQNFHPMDPRIQPVYEMAQRLAVPVMFGKASPHIARVPLKYGHPELLEDVAVAYPELRMCVTHMGCPWQAETIALIRKHPNVYADLSGVHAHPWELYNTLRLALEYGVMHKILFGTDYPFFTAEQTISGLMRASELAQTARLPEIPRERIKEIIHHDSFVALGIRPGATDPCAPRPDDAVASA